VIRDGETVRRDARSHKFTFTLDLRTLGLSKATDKKEMQKL